MGVDYESAIELTLSHSSKKNGTILKKKRISISHEMAIWRLRTCQNLAKCKTIVAPTPFKHCQMDTYKTQCNVIEGKMKYYGINPRTLPNGYGDVEASYR